MANIKCLSAETVNKLKDAAKKGQFNITEMYLMSSAERNALFSKYVDKDTAAFVNAGFERAMISENQNALKNWAKKTFKGSEKKEAKMNDILSKIDNLSKMGVLTPKGEKAFLQDLVAAELGATVTEEETKNINDLTVKLAEAKAKVKNVGDPTENQAEQLEYFKAKRKLENYLDSLTPSGKLKVLTSTIARGNMLFRLGSILVNINSNNIEGTVGATVRRLTERAVNGTNTRLIGDMVKFNAKVFRETGYDITRMVTLESEKKVLGESMVTSQGPGTIRKIGRWYEDKVFNLTQGLPDVIAASLAFGDRANIVSTKMAYAEGLKGKEAQMRAKEIFKDALTIEPKTEEGKALRTIAIADAQRSTNTDKRIFAEKLLKFRNLLNVGDLRFGDMNIPFVKTTANAIQSALQHSGVTLPVEVVVDSLRVIKYVQSGQGWKESTKAGFTGFGESVIRAGIGFLVAYLLANAIDTKDYMGVYPTSQKERELLELRNATPNSIRIGDKWISLDWFGPLMAPLVGVLNAKKYGKDPASAVFFYGTGALYQVQKAPGLDYMYQTLDSLNKFLTGTTEKTVKSAQDAVANYMIDFVISRFIPGFISQLTQLTDNVVRDTSRKNDILAPLKNVIPGFRQSLPPNYTIFGETTRTEGWLNVLFGSRVKSGRDNAVVTELVRLQNAGMLPSITDVSKTSPRVDILRSQIGDKETQKYLLQFGADFKQGIDDLLQESDYQDANNEEKSNMINNLKTRLFNEMLDDAGYVKPE